jgi:hypothetical protein
LGKRVSLLLKSGTVPFATVARMYQQRGGTLKGDADGLRHFTRICSHIYYTHFLPHANDSNLLTLVEQHQSTSCADPRDKIYAMNALVEAGEVVMPVDYGIGTLELLRRLIEKRFDDEENPVYDHVLRVATGFGSTLMVRSSLCCGHWAKEMLKRRYKQRRGRGEIGMREGELLLLSFEARDDDRWQETQNKYGTLYIPNLICDDCNATRTKWATWDVVGELIPGQTCFRMVLGSSTVQEEVNSRHETQRRTRAEYLTARPRLTATDRQFLHSEVVDVHKRVMNESDRGGYVTARSNGMTVHSLLFASDTQMADVAGAENLHFAEAPRDGEYAHRQVYRRPMVSYHYSARTSAHIPVHADSGYNFF